MLRILTFVLFLSTFSQVNAVEINFLGACSKIPLLSENVLFKPRQTVGEISLQVLDQHGIPYSGTAAGLNQVFATPVGLDAMEVISDNEMLAYGWCFEVDGKIPEVFADKIPVKKTTKLISWFYGYAHFLNGEWISQCEKAYLRPSPVFCRDIQ